MNAALVAARLLLASVFVLAAAAKIADREGSGRAVREFRVPERLALPAASLIPFAELGIAVAFLIGPMARWAAISAMVLLAVFSAAIAIALARGERIDCHCFGELSNAPVSRVSLLRNGALAGLAAFVALAPNAPGSGVGSWLAARSDAWLAVFCLGFALAGLAAATAWFGRELLRQQGRLLLRLDALDGPAPSTSGLPIGAPAPSFALDSWPSGLLTLDRLLASGLPLALVFSDAQCAPCAAALPVVAEAQHNWAERLTIAVVSKGVTEQSEVAWREHELEHVGIAPDHDVALSYGIPGSPGAVLVSPEGRIDSSPALGIAQIAELFRAAAERSVAPTRHANGARREGTAHVRTA
jgi:uncharacterized membrane protein YphA (DoxX/SURF4 family)